MDHRLEVDDGDIAAVVNAVTKAATTFAGTQQLRARVVDVLVPLLLRCSYTCPDNYRGYQLRQQLAVLQAEWEQLEKEKEQQNERK